MKALVAFYSRTGRNRKVAEFIASQLNADLEDIKCPKYNLGFIGYWLAGRDGMKKKFCSMKQLDHDPGKYDIVIVGGPVWGWKISPPIRTYLHDNSFKKIAFFTVGGNPNPKVIFKEMEEYSQKPVTSLSLRQKEADADSYHAKVQAFLKKLK